MWLNFLWFSWSNSVALDCWLFAIHVLVYLRSLEEKFDFKTERTMIRPCFVLLRSIPI